MKNFWPVLTLFFLAFLLRLFLLPLPAFAIDMTDWLAWANHLLRVGPSQFYTTIWSDYLPAYLYGLWALAGIHQIFSFIPYEILMKLPAVMADLGIGYLVYKIVKEKVRKRLALTSAALFLFNPLALFNSSIWGQVDAVFSLILLLGIYSLMKGREKLAAVFLGIAFLFKPQAAFFLPLIFIYFLKEKKLALFFGLLLIFSLTVFALSLPFFPRDPLFGLGKLILKSAATYPYTSIFAMNFWGIFGVWKPDNTIFLNLSYQIWGMILLGLGLIFAWISFWKNRDDGRPLYLSSSLIVLAFFMLPTRVHERWLYSFFPFFLVLAASFNNWRFWLSYFLLSAIHFLNLYFVYTYYTVNFLRVEPVFKFIGENFNRFSFVSVLLYGFILFLTFKEK